MPRSEAPLNPLLQLGQETLTRRLEDAITQARTGFPQGYDAFIRAIDEARDRVEALSAAESAMSADDDDHDEDGANDVGATAEISHRAMAVLAATDVGGEPKREFRLIAFGEVELERPLAGETFEFSRQHAEAAVRWFAEMGRKLAIDYEHQSFERFNNRADGLRPAAGWIGGLEMRDDGLWAVEVEWTERAAELLRSGEYRYFSPVIFWSDAERSELAGLGPVALTNDPAMRHAPSLAASRQTSMAEDASSNPEAELRAALRAADDEVTLLKRRLEAEQADAFIERGMRLGKIVDANSMDWRSDFLRDAALAEARLTRAPVLLPPGRVLAANRAGPSSTNAANGVMPELYRNWGIDAADIGAFERATAAGRVRRYGAQN